MGVWTSKSPREFAIRVIEDRNVLRIPEHVSLRKKQRFVNAAPLGLREAQFLSCDRGSLSSSLVSPSKQFDGWNHVGTCR